jgi:two-component system, NarL family, nitrate/nitrite sensor histidine kinase NarX
MHKRWQGRVDKLIQTSSLQNWLALLFLAFLLLVVISVGLTFWGLDAQKQDARIINLAGRQRMLIRQMTSVALEYQQEGEAHYHSDLLEAADTFGQTLGTFRYGGAITDYAGRPLVLAPPADQGLITELDRLDRGWQEFRSQMALVTRPGGSPSQAAIQGMEASAPQLVDQADRVVQVYEDLSATKITRLHWIQLGFLVSGLVLLGLGWWLTRAVLVRPLKQLELSARQIGEGDLGRPVRAGGPAEIHSLGNTLETMRSQLLSSSRELNDWVNTLEHRVKQRTQELEALAAVSQDISSHLNIGEVLQSVTEKAQMLLGSEVALLCLLDDQGQTLHLHSAAGPEAAAQKSFSTVQSQVTTQMLFGRVAVPCGVQACPGFCEILNPSFRVSHLAMPLRTGRQVIGALCVGGSKPAMFGPESGSVLAQLAGIAAVALENSRLYEAAEHRAALEERQRIASEIHDGLLQTLGYLRWMVGISSQQLSEGELPKALMTFQKIEHAERQAESEIRQAVASLQEDFPARYTLQELLTKMVEEAASRPSPRVQWENHVSQPVVLPRAESEQVLRVAREALLNARYHGQADTIVVCFEKAAHELILSVVDNGVGFVTNPAVSGETPPGERSHFGLKIMEARASRLGGRVAIDSSPGKGTRVTLRWSPEGKRLSGECQ